MVGMGLVDERMARILHRLAAHPADLGLRVGRRQPPRAVAGAEHPVLPHVAADPREELQHRRRPDRLLQPVERRRLVGEGHGGAPRGRELRVPRRAPAAASAASRSSCASRSAEAAAWAQRRLLFEEGVMQRRRHAVRHPRLVERPARPARQPLVIARRPRRRREVVALGRRRFGRAPDRIPGLRPRRRARQRDLVGLEQPLQRTGSSAPLPGRPPSPWFYSALVIGIERLAPVARRGGAPYGRRRGGERGIGDSGRTRRAGGDVAVRGRGRFGSKRVSLKGKNRGDAAGRGSRRRYSWTLPERGSSVTVSRNAGSDARITRVQ